MNVSTTVTKIMGNKLKDSRFIKTNKINLSLPKNISQCREIITFFDKNINS